VIWNYVSTNSNNHFPVIGEMYLPEEWINNEQKLKAVGVPKRRFKFKKNGK
jgi:hypothetical protein